jgi:hypothetical protein
MYAVWATFVLSIIALNLLYVEAQAPSNKQIKGSGNVGRISKFTHTNAIGDSVITELKAALRGRFLVPSGLPGSAIRRIPITVTALRGTEGTLTSRRVNAGTGDARESIIFCWMASLIYPFWTRRPRPVPACPRKTAT